jgi:type IV pilus secretin PilQ/predicted competence protein
MFYLNRRVQRIAESGSLPALFLVVGMAYGAAVSGCGLAPNKGPQVIRNQAVAEPPSLRSQPGTREEQTPSGLLKLQDLSVFEEGGQTTLSIKFSQPIAEYRHFPLSQPSRIVIDVLSDAKRAPLSESFRIDTHWVGTLRLTANQAGLRLATDIAAATVPAYVVTPEDGGLKIVIGLFNPNATAKRQTVLVKDGVRSDIRSAGPVSSLKSSNQDGTSSLASQPKADDKKYTGQKISLEFKDADIKNVFRLLAEISGGNIIVTDDVSRKITVRLIEIPWDQALDLLIETNGLGKDEVGNIIRISTQERLKSDSEKSAAARKAKEIEEPLITSYLTVNYAKVVKGQNDTTTDKDLVERAKALLSPRGKIEADQRTNTLIVRDIKSSIDEIQSLIGRIDTRTPQILIESNLIETTPTFSRALGIQMAAAFNGGRVRTDTAFRADSPFSGPSATFFEGTTPVISPAQGFAFGYFGNNVAAILSAAEEEGNVKIISRPSVVTLNNIESQIESANIIRIRTTAATVGEAGGVEEVRAGITLKVTPQVSADGFVLLNITAKSSTLDFGRVVDGIPQENTREAKANVLVRDGETVVIGGIMKDTGSNSDTGVPYLKEIPVLGWLFKKVSWRKDFEELVVFITPRILAAGSENLPTAEQIWRNQMKQTEGTASVNSPLNPQH